MDLRYRFARGIGAYGRTVTCGGFVRLEVDGLGLRGSVFFDGRKLGDIETAYMAATYRFDAGPNGPHRLVILADNRLMPAPEANFYEWYDIYGYGGLYRSVRIEPENAYWLDRLAVTTQDYQTGTIRVRAALDGAVPAGLRYSICRQGKVLASGDLADNQMEAVFQVPDFQLWSPEHPNLDTLTFEAGQISRSVTFGVRQLAWKDGHLRLNGTPLKLLGYNRHDAHPDFGCAIPYEDMARDLRMIHDQGANFIRGSHYPQSEEMLSLCDRLGLLVWDESLGWGDRPESLCNPEFVRKAVDQTRSMVRRSINHPCIVIWGFLNELRSQFESCRPAVQKLVDLVHAEDDSRPVTYASCAYRPVTPGADEYTEDKCHDIPDILAFNNYPGWYYRNSGPFFCEKDVLDEVELMMDFAAKYPGKPVIFSEIGAAATPGGYDPVRGSEQYQAELLLTALKKVWTDDRITGIAIWQFCDNRTHNVTNASSTPQGFNIKGVVDAYRHPKYAWCAIHKFLAEIGVAGHINERIKNSIAN